MNHTAFFNELKSGKTHGVYLFHGGEEYVKDKAVVKLIESLLGGTPEELNYTKLDGAAQADDIITSCEVLPFMAEKRVVEVVDSKYFTGSPNKEEIQALTKYISDMPDHCCLLFLIRGGADKRKGMYKAMKPVCCEVEFDILDEYELIKWLQAEAQKNGVGIPRECAEFMIRLRGKNLYDLSHEMSKLAALKGGNAITKEDIDAVVTHSLEYNVFRMTDEYFRGNMGAGNAMLQEMLYAGESIQGIIGAVAARFRQLLYAKALLREMDERAVEDKLGKGYGVKLAIKDCKKMKMEHICRAISILSDVDADIKRGRAWDIPALHTALHEIFS